MNAAQLHLALNHLPLFGLAFGLLISLYGLFRKSEEIKRVALGLFVLGALAAIPTYLTGEPAEEVIEGMAGVGENFIEEHEASAVASLIAIEVAGAVALLGLWLSRRPQGAPPVLVNGAALVAVVALAMAAWTAHLGGQIHHPELRSGAAAPLPDQAGEREAEHRDSD